MTDFHIYPNANNLSFVLDYNDPLKDALLQAMHDVFNGAGRAREADECLDAKGWTPDNAL